MRHERFRAKLIGDDTADAVDEIGQVFGEIEFGGGLHGGWLGSD